MGIFTDESHVERVQTDDAKRERQLPITDDRKLLTEEQIKRDLTFRMMDEAIRVVLAAVGLAFVLSMFWLMTSYTFWACAFFGVSAVPFLVFFIVYLCRMIRFMRCGRKIYVYRTIVLDVSRQAIAWILNWRFRSLFGYTVSLKNFRALPDDFSRPLCAFRAGEEVYVVTFDHKTSVELYSCRLYRWEKEEQPGTE